MSSADTTEETKQEEEPKLQLDVKVDKTSSCERHVTVTVPQPEIERYVKKAYETLQPKAEVPGFRIGRAPRKLVESKFKEQVRDQVKHELLMDSMAQANDDAEYSAISEPDFDYEAVTMPEDSELTYEFTIEVRPEFDMPDWKGLAIEKPTKEYSDDEVGEHLQKLLERYGNRETIEEAAQAGDFVTVDVAFKYEDESISDLEAESIRIQPTLSFRDSKLEGFDKLMTGVSAGDTKEAKITVSEDSENEDLRGKDVTAEFEILEVQRIKLPPLNAAFLDKIGGFDDENDLRTAVREELERQLKYHQQQRLREQITAQLLKDADFDLPEALVKRQTDRELRRSVLELQAAGFDDQAIQTYANTLRQNSKASTIRSLKEHFIFERIAEDEKIEETDKDYEDEIELIADQSNESARRVRARLEKQNQMDALRNQIIERKTIDLIVESANVKESKFEGQSADTTSAVDHAIAHVAGAIPEALHGGDAEDLPQPVEHD